MLDFSIQMQYNISIQCRRKLENVYGSPNKRTALEMKMMKKLLAISLALLCTAALFAACGSKDKKSSKAAAGSGGAAESNSPDGLKAPVSQNKLDVKDGLTENMLIRSVHSEGSKARLAAKLRKAKAGKQLSVVFLGDSITAGSSADTAHQYTNVVSEWWKQSISEKTVFHNAGIGATDSYYAAHRVQRDVFAYDPDVIFIEFINDRDDSHYKEAMESLVRKCLARPNDPAVILIEMTLKGGGNAQGAHSAVAAHYGLPVISYHDAVAPEVGAGNFSFDDISPDGTHPNNIGHGWIADMIKNFIAPVYSEADNITEEVKAFDPGTAPLTDNRYESASIIDSTDSTVCTDKGSFTEGATPYPFKNGWRTENGGSITFEMEFRNLGMCFYKSTDGKTGSVKVSVDGTMAGLVNGNFPNGWGSYGASTELYTSDSPAKHTVTVTVLEGDRQNFEILEWLVS